MADDQTALPLDDPRAEPVCPDRHEITVDIRVDVTLMVDVAKLAFLHREHIHSDDVTKLMEADGLDEDERFEGWLHYYLLDRFDVHPPHADGIRETFGMDPEIDFRLNDGDRAAIEAGFNPRFEIPQDA